MDFTSQNAVSCHSFPCSLSVFCPFALTHLGQHISHFISSTVEEQVTMLTSLEINDTLEPQDTWKTELFYFFTSIVVKELVLAKEHR